MSNSSEPLYGGNFIPRRKFIKVASWIGSGVAAGNLFRGFSSLARADSGAAGFDSGMIAAPKAADIYVATNGDDQATGTQTTPFRTLARAQAAVRARQPLRAPITVWVRAGTYYLTSPLACTPADSGSVQAPITYAAYPGENVTLSGGVRLSPTWSNYSGSIKVADIGMGHDFDMLFLNEDKLLILARYPNYDADAVPLQGSADNAPRVAKWSNPAGGYIRAMHELGWGGESFKINGKNGTALDLTWVGDNNRGHAINSSRQVAENIFEELDAPEEWFYDKSTGRLYLYPPDGADLASSFFVGATLEELIRIVGTAEAKVKHLTFSGFTLTHTHRTLFTSAYEGLSRGDWAIARKGTVYLQDTESIVLKDCNFMNIGGNGVFMSGHNLNNAVTGCNFVHVGATAVAIVGLPSSTWYYCTRANIGKMPTNLTPGPATENYPKNITVSYCYMYDNGMFEKQTAAVCISMSQRVTVSHCTSHRGPRSGININDGTFGGHIIEHNDIFDQVRETSDHGPFNSWGRDRWWPGMDGDEARKYALIDVVQPNTIRNNRITCPADRNLYGIDLDDGSTNYRIYNNLLVNCGVKSQRGFDHTISNNIFIRGLVTCHQWKMPDMRKIVTGNIIVNSSPYYCRTRDFKPNTGMIDYNLFWNNGSPVALQIDDGKNEISATSIWAGYGLDPHSVTADPRFVDAVKGDYKVKDGSPALALGFENFPMDQFGKPGYPVPPGFQMTKARAGDHFATSMPGASAPAAGPSQKVNLGPVGE